MAQPHDRASGLLAGPSEMLLYLEESGADPALASFGRDGLDPLADVLKTVKLTGALFFLVEASSPWGIQVPRSEVIGPVILPRTQHIVSYHIVLDGSGWAALPGTTPTRFEAGDILLFARGDAYSMLSGPDQSPEFDCDATLVFLRDMAAGKLPFVIREGGAGPDHARFVCGYLGCDIRPFNPVLAALPPLLHVKRPIAVPPGLLDGLIELTLAEARTHRTGGISIRLRLSELLFVEVVRSYLSQLPGGRSGWFSGLRDPAIGRVIAMLHERPAWPWTLKELADLAGMSRAVLAERFSSLVGCPPMQYLMLWRMQVAARLLADGVTKVAAAAGSVGYESEAAFSRAFKKVTGVPPAEWRSRQAPDSTGL